MTYSTEIDHPMVPGFGDHVATDPDDGDEPCDCGCETPDAESIATALHDAFGIVVDSNDVEEAGELLIEALPGLDRVISFADSGLLTRDAGLVLRFTNGSEFQLTIVQSGQ